MALLIREISSAEHLSYVTSRSSVSFLQTPAWGGVKAEWQSRSLGWFDDGALVGAALVLGRRVPKLKQWLAYLPEGPALDWDKYSPQEWLAPLLAHLKEQGAFQAKIGPTVAIRRWTAVSLKDAIAEGNARRLRDVTPDESFDDGAKLIGALRAMGWTQQPDTGAGFGDVQPRYVFQIPLKGRTEDDVFKGFNQLWRRNIRKAEKLGVKVERVGRDGLKDFHPVYAETAARDGFVPRGLHYFERMWDAMSQEDPDRMRLYLASHEGKVLAGTTMVTVGNHTWYSYGASADIGREVRPSNAIQWRMITDAIEEGRDTYDLRGVSDTLDEADPLFGLIRFKLGTGGEALEYVGEWDYALRPTTAKAFDLYMRRADIKSRVVGKLPRRSVATP